MPHQVVANQAISIDEVEAGFATLQPGDDERFETMRRAVVAYQRVHNPIYSRYCDSFPDWETPYLPVEAFKHGILATCNEPETIFVSSGTGQGFIKNMR